MKLTIHFQYAAAPLTLELEAKEDAVLKEIREARASGSLLEFEDVKGDRVLVFPETIAYVSVPSETGRRVGFGRA